MNSQLQCDRLDRDLIDRGYSSLNPIQRIILSGSLAGESYPEIAGQSGYAVEYLREVGAQLWKVLSQLFDKTVTKRNIQQVLQGKTLVVTTPEPQYVWDEAIDVSVFYGRTPELQMLSQWVIIDRCRSISIQAIGGMGKTSLAMKLTQQIAPEFEFVVWRSLRNAPPLTALLTDLVILFSRQRETNLPTDSLAMLDHLMSYLRQSRCLLVLDNVESILMSGSSHQYLTGYEGYGELFRQVAEGTHQSCLLSTSREQISEISSFAGHSLPVRILALNGLPIEDGVNVLDDKGLYITIDLAQDLIDLYHGNPLALKIVSTSILELFDGQVEAFLKQGVAVFNGIKVLLEKQFDRLSPIETQVMHWLAIRREWVSLKDLQGDFFPAITLAQLLEALEYLRGRSLIEQKAGRFTQQPVVMEYATDQLLATVCREISQQHPQILLQYALMQAQVPEYLRDSQVRTIIAPLLRMLESNLGGQGIVIHYLRQLLTAFSGNEAMAASYGAGNCLNLLCQLQADLQGLDLSGLQLRQADLRNANLAQVNLTGCNLSTVLFADVIGDAYKVCLSPDDRLLAKGGSDGKIAVWEVQSGHYLLNIPAHEGNVVGLVFTHDSQALISSSFDRKIAIWDVASGACLRSWQLATTTYRITLSHDGTILATSSNSGDVLLWDIATGKQVATLSGHSLTAVDVAFHPNDRLLASCSFDASIKIWDLETAKCLQTLVGHTGIITAIDFNALGTHLVSSSFDKSIKIWQVDSGECLQTLEQHSNAVIDVVFSPTGDRVISASHDLTVKIWDMLPSGHWECTQVLQGHDNTIWSIALNSTGDMLVSSDQSGVLMFWQLPTGLCLKTFRSVSKAVKSLAFHPDADLLASSYEDRHIRL